jgi:dienelactone hydrolase
MKRFSCLILLLVSACAQMPSPQQRRDAADRLAATHGWHAVMVPARAFDLLAYVPAHFAPSMTLTVYIEGDGLAWVNPSQASDDPTPADPLALRLALSQPDGLAVYLARPCQYGGMASPTCTVAYWTSKRFAPEAVAATNAALDALKQRFSARYLVLVGYSGGAAVAALTAARRCDVIRLVTVAGILAHRAWSAWHRVPALKGSLNPADEIDALHGIPQWHFVGRQDAVMPPRIIQDYADRFAPDQRPRVMMMDGFDHHCCWAQHWPALLQRVERAVAGYLPDTLPVNDMP